jgi:AcrR family transcriptional regulator
MVIRQRAILAEDKQERHHAILDATEALLLRSPEHGASVAEVAREAGLAKGTVYLYFHSKEELLLAVHERGIDRYFRAVDALLAGSGPVAVDDMLALTRKHVIEPPLFLPMASRCLGVMSQHVPEEFGIAFHLRMADRLERAGAGLERHFGELARGEGLALLRRSYALILGLWQMSLARGAEGAQKGATPVVPASPVFVWSYPAELDRALRALWQGSLGANARKS